jgi:hypothetical protein
MLAALASIAAAVLFLAKLWTIGTYGNSTPYWDQWGAEAAGLYKPWMEGALSPGDLLKAHNEHRIMTTRVVHLGLFEALGQRWDPLAQMYVNAILHVAALAAFILFAFHAVSGPFRPLLLGFCAVLFSIPFGWENVLAGFQAQFYLLLLLSFPFLVLCCRENLNTQSCLLACSLAVMLVLTLASGALTVLAGAGILLLRRYILKEKAAPLVCAAILVGIGLTAISLTPSIDVHSPLKAQSVWQLFAAIGKAAAWPLQPETLGFRDALYPLLMQLPLCAGILVAYRLGKQQRRAFLFFAAMLLWFGLQIAALSYGRGAVPLSSRYTDILCFGIAANFAALLFLWDQVRGFLRVMTIALSAAWIVSLGYGAWSLLPKLRQELVAKAEVSLLQQTNVHQYLLTGDRKWLTEAKFHEIPLPSADQLQQMLDDKTIRSFLPEALFREVAATADMVPRAATDSK